MNPVSIGDLAQSLLLRRAMAGAQGELASLTADLAAGQAADPARHLQGQVAPILAIDAAVLRNSALTRSVAQASARTDAAQSVLSRIETVASDASRILLTSGLSTDPVSQRAAGEQARSAFQSVVSALNTRFAGQGLFAGTATDRAALVPADDILAATRAVTSGATSPAEAESRLRVWFSDPAGFAATAYRGTDEPITIPIGPEETVPFNFTAADKELHGSLIGLALGALVAEGRFAPPAQAELARLAGQRLVSSSGDLAGYSARLGTLQASVESAGARLAGESTAYGMLRNDLLSVDLGETSSRIAETETRLQMMFALTARLSRLSLADYL